MSVLAVLMFHAVGTAMPSGLEDLTVSPGQLAEQLAALRAEGYALQGLTDALDTCRAGRPVVALTFDDAYRDFATAGLSVLADAGAGATLYAPTRDLGGCASWLPGGGADQPLLELTELGDLTAQGVEIGSHGARHVPLDVLAPRVVADELAESRAVLEDAVQRPVTSLCYPHGYTSRGLRRRVRAAGYTTACAIGHRLHDLAGDPLAVSRLHVGPAHDPHTLVRLVREGPSPLVPALKRAAGPAWRAARRTAWRTAGVRWT